MSKLTGTLIASTTQSWSNHGNVAANAVDGNVVSFFDAPDASGHWVGLDLGAPTVIPRIDYAPRASFEIRMIGGIFQGANKPDFSDAVMLYTITAKPASGQLTSAVVTNATGVRYLRYLGPSNSYCNIAEIEPWGLAASVPTVSPGFTASPLSARTYYVDGEAGSETNPCTTPAAPLKTINPVMGRMMNGDSVLWKAGTVNVPPNGYMKPDNMYLGMYGVGANPKILCAAGEWGLQLHGANILVQFVDVIGDNQTTVGIDFHNSGQRAEGCRIIGHYQGINIIQNNSPTLFRTALARNFVNVGDGHSQGAFVNLAQNVDFDSVYIGENGWNGTDTTTANEFSHGLYLHDGTVSNSSAPPANFYPVTIKNSILGDNGGNGAMARSGLLGTDILAIDNGINGVSILAGGLSSTISRFVVTGFADTVSRSVQRGNGISLAALTTTINSGLFLGVPGAVYGPALTISKVDSNQTPCAASGAISINDITIVNWPGTGIAFENPYHQVSMTNMKVGVMAGQLTVDDRVEPTNLIASGNAYTANPEFSFGGAAPQPFAAWNAKTHEPLQTFTVTSVATIEQYAASLGLPATGTALLAAIEANCGPQWNDNLSATAINAFLNAGVKVGN